MSCGSPLPSDLAEVEALQPRPLGSPDRCEEHEQSLTMFCLDDLEPLCKQCAAASHEGHRVYLLTEATADCKEELRASLNALIKKLSHFEIVAQTCDHTAKHNQVEVELTERQIRKQFERLHRLLQEEEKARILVLRREEEERKREAERRTGLMNQLIESLEDRIQLIEEELEAGGDGAHFLQHYQDTTERVWTASRELQSRDLVDVAKHLGNLQFAVWDKMKHISPRTPVTLDPRTAGASLRVSAELNSVQVCRPESEPRQHDPVPVPANPERFHPNSAILARESFSSGVHCWDVEVGNAGNWTVGVAAESVSRREEIEACPEAGVWCISLRDGEYRALTTPAQTLSLHGSEPLKRLHIRLDWDEGRLEFTDADTNTHLFAFSHHFTEKVYPYFESISEGGSLAVLAQPANVSVDSHVPAEDPANARDCRAKSEPSTEGEYINSPTNETPDRNPIICSQRERTKSKLQQLRVQPAAKKKTSTSESKPAVRKQAGKPRFSTAYHVSLKKPSNTIDNQPGSHKQSQMNSADLSTRSSCDEL